MSKATDLANLGMSLAVVGVTTKLISGLAKKVKGSKKKPVFF